MKTINTAFGPVMLTYSLVFRNDNAIVDGELYVNPDDARDVAFVVAQETGLDVAIFEEFGMSSNLFEVVEA